jgi:hypothetical protein
LGPEKSETAIAVARSRSKFKLDCVYHLDKPKRPKLFSSGERNKHGIRNPGQPSDRLAGDRRFDLRFQKYWTFSL